MIIRENKFDFRPHYFLDRIYRINWIIFIFSTSRTEVEKLNPLSAENLFFNKYHEPEYFLTVAIYYLKLMRMVTLAEGGLPALLNPLLSFSVRP
jgi:hypothetical protein